MSRFSFYFKLRFYSYPANPRTCAAKIEVWIANLPFSVPGIELFPGPSMHRSSQRLVDNVIYLCCSRTRMNSALTSRRTCFEQVHNYIIRLEQARFHLLIVVIHQIGNCSAPTSSFSHFIREPCPCSRAWSILYCQVQ